MQKAGGDVLAKKKVLVALPVSRTGCSTTAESSQRLGFDVTLSDR